MQAYHFNCKNMKLKLFIVVLFTSVMSWGQILTFDFAGLAGNETSASSNFNDANLTSSSISRGTGLTASANADRFNSNNWAVTSIANAVSGNKYVEFTITPNSGYQFSISSIVVQWQRSGTGNTQIALRSSADGYATNLDAIKNVVDNTSTQTFTYTFIQANSSTAVTYRLYSYAESTTGTGGPGDGAGNDIVVNGSVTPLVVSTVDWCNVQSPANGTITQGGAFNVYAQAYEPSVTEAAGIGTGIQGWIGYSTANTDPSTAGWTWVAASFNTQVGNNDELVADIGSALAPGTYYYASRFQLNGGPFRYGGYNGGFWDGSSNVNGVLTVNPSVVDWCNVQWPASGSITEGGTYTVYAQVYESGVTDPAGQGAGIQGWIGYSTANTDPSSGGWTWVAASFNAQSGNNDEYQAEIGSLLSGGTYYYASRFQLGSGAYRYGGFNGGFWDGTSNVNGVLTVTAPPVITSSLAAAGNVGAAFSYDIVATNSPTSYNATGLPAGLSINTTNGQITGTPTGAGTFNVTISATNAYGTDTETLVITLTTGPCLSQVTFTSLPSSWAATNITYAAGEANFASFTGELTTLAISNPSSLTFDLRRTTNSNAKDMIIEVSTTTQGGTYTSIFTYNHGNTTSGGTTLCTVDLSAYTSFSSVFIRFRKNSSTTSPWYLDNINVYCGTPPDVEIDVEGNSISIVNGDNTPSLTDDTDFGTTLVGNDVSYTFTITNAGSDDLDISGITITGLDAADFYISVSPSSTVVAGGSTTFEVTFSPASAGTSNATINIDNNDSDENPYTFDIVAVSSFCVPTTSISLITPFSGPAGTVVTINGNGFSTASNVNFGAYTASFTLISESIIEAIVPVGAASGNIIIQDAGGCDTSFSTFTVIKEDNSSCEGIAVTSDLIIYDLHDEYIGDGGFITIYNGTASTVDMADYTLWRTSNYGDGNEIDYATLTGTIASGSLGVIRVNTVGCGPVGTNGIIDSGFNGNDQIQLRNAAGTIIIDDVHTYFDKGYYMVRNTGALSARTTFVASDWSITPLAAGECWPSAGLVLPSGSGNSPSVTLNPVDVNAGCPSITASLTVSGSEGVVGGLGLAYQWYENIPGNAGWSAISNGGVYSGANSATLYISSTSGLNNYQYYCQIRENDATCYTATEAAIIKDEATVWNGSDWSNGVPDATKFATINGNYDTALHGSFECCSLLVNATYTLDIQANNYVEVTNDIINNGTLNVMNNGSLVQINDLGVNTGNISYRRATTGVALDYVYWSSPVDGVNTPSGYIYTWIPDVANPNGGQGNWASAANTLMQPAIGYIMRGVLSRNFIGVPRNGVYTPTIKRGSDIGAGSVGPNGVMRLDTDDNWNLLGNPYPSAISIGSFLAANTELDGFVRLWTHGTLPSTAIADPFYDNFVSNYTASDYIAINGSGATSGSGTLSVIGGGQSFFVLMNSGTATTSTALFNNAMRDKGYSNSQFYRSTNNVSHNTVGGDVERHRIWLDLVTPSQTIRTLVAYVEGATQEKDRMFDATTGYKSAQNFYSLIDENNIMTIQGRALPFDAEDKVPLGFKTNVSGDYTLALAEVDGLFSANQNIYIEDKDLGVIHDLKIAPYNFIANDGIHNSRFVLRYTNETLSNEDFELNSNVLITASNTISIHALKDTIQSVHIHNVLGQDLLVQREINATTFEISSLQKNTVPLIVQVTLSNGVVVTKKIIY